MVIKSRYWEYLSEQHFWPLLHDNPVCCVRFRGRFGSEAPPVGCERVGRIRLWSAVSGVCVCVSQTETPAVSSPPVADVLVWFIALTAHKKVQFSSQLQNNNSLRCPFRDRKLLAEQVSAAKMMLINVWSAQVTALTLVCSHWAPHITHTHPMIQW